MRPATLLLADDSTTIHRVIELSFADEDVRVVAVTDGREALRSVEEDQPDIVLADIGIVYVDGYAVAAHVKHTPMLKHIPVLLLGGAFEPIDEERAKAAGCDGVLLKPLEPKQLVAKVKDLLAHRAPRDLWQGDEVSRMTDSLVQQTQSLAAEPVLPPAPPPFVPPPPSPASAPPAYAARNDELDWPPVPEIKWPSPAEAPVPAAGPLVEPLTSSAVSETTTADLPAPAAGDEGLEFDLLDAALVHIDPAASSTKAGHAVPDPLVHHAPGASLDWLTPLQPAGTPAPDLLEVPELPWTMPTEPAWAIAPKPDRVSALVPPAEAEPPAPVERPAATPLTSPVKLSISSAFSALLSAEQARSGAAAPLPAAVVRPFVERAVTQAPVHTATPAESAPAIPQHVLEEAVRRVLAQMTGEVVRQVVTDTAERLVREEIERIKENPG